MKARLDNRADVSIVIPFLNRRELVAPCLNAIFAQEGVDDFDIEVLAIDNGSTDGTIDALKAFPVRLISCAIPGAAAARNEGIREARGRIVAFTDSDCRVDKHWLLNLLQPYRDQEMLGTGGKIAGPKVDNPITHYSTMSRLLNQRKYFGGVLCFPPFFATANASYRRDVLLQVGGFDESLHVSEDSDLTWRVLEVGGKIAYCPDSIVEHHHRDTYGGFFRQAIEYGSAAATVFAKHRYRFGMPSMIEWDNLMALAALPFEIPLHILFKRHSSARFFPVYDAIWRTGFTIGRIRGSLKNRVIFL